MPISCNTHISLIPTLGLDSPSCIPSTLSFKCSVVGTTTEGEMADRIELRVERNGELVYTQIQVS